MGQVNFRMTDERLALIDRAAAIRGVTRTESVLRSSEAAAIETFWPEWGSPTSERSPDPSTSSGQAWEDCEHLLRRLGYSAQIRIEATR